MPDPTIPPNWQGRTDFDQSGPIRMTNGEPLNSQYFEPVRSPRLRIVRAPRLAAVVVHHVEGN
jgi:hypothetical protein